MPRKPATLTAASNRPKRARATKNAPEKVPPTNTSASESESTPEARGITKAPPKRKRKAETTAETAASTTAQGVKRYKKEAAVEHKEDTKDAESTNGVRDGELNGNTAEASGDAEGPNIAYWLMKAEPESRIEKGIDVKFSIEDLQATSEPEPWEGVRNHVAKKNMMAMKIGDLAFFYHSNCKVPGVAGVMEIVQESSPDKSAFDSKHPYYDPKSDPEKPKWFHVHVAFHEKFPKLVPLKELQLHKEDTLKDMQGLKQSRLSVSKISKAEWEFIMELARQKGKHAAAIMGRVD